MKNIFCIGLILLFYSCNNFDTKDCAINHRSVETNTSNYVAYDTTLYCGSSKIRCTGYYSTEKGNKYATLFATQRNDTIYEIRIDKNSFGISDKDFLKKANLHKIYLDSLKCKDSKLYLSCFINVPETDWTYGYSIDISQSGTYTYVELIDNE